MAITKLINFSFLIFNLSYSYLSLELFTNIKENNAYSIEFSKDFLIVGNRDGFVKFFKLSDFTLYWESLGHKEIVRNCVVVNDSLFVTGSEDSTIIVWYPKKKKILKRIKLNSEIRTLAFLPNKSLLAIGCFNGEVIIFNIKNWQKEKSISLFDSKEGITSLSFSYDGKYLFAGNKNVKIIDVETLEEINILKKKHADFVSAIKVLPEKNLLITADGIYKIYLWNLAKWNEMTSYKVIANIRDIEVVKGKYLLIGSFRCPVLGGKNALFCLDILQNKKILERKLPAGVLSLAISPNEKQLAIATGKGVFIYNIFTFD